MVQSNRSNLSPPGCSTADGIPEWADAPDKSQQWAHTMIFSDAEYSHGPIYLWYASLRRQVGGMVTALQNAARLLGVTIFQRVVYLEIQIARHTEQLTRYPS
jgi:hypothetical protein